MSTKHVSAAEAKARFAALLDDVQHRGNRYVVERHGREVAALVGVEEAERLGSPLPDEAAGALALLGLWSDIPDEEIDALLEDLRDAREQDRGRTVRIEP